MVSEIRQPDQGQEQKQEQAPEAVQNAAAQEAHAQSTDSARVEGPAGQEQTHSEAGEERGAQPGSNAAEAFEPEPQEALVGQASAGEAATSLAPAQAPPTAPATTHVPVTTLTPAAATVQTPPGKPVETAPVKESTAEISPEVYIPEFGIFDMVYLEPDRRYQGRLYRLSHEQVKSLSETIGFTARFDHPNIRIAIVDVVKTEGHILFEIDRNTKPTELNLRYSRDRWSVSEAGSRGADALRPWIKSNYDCRFLPEKVGQVIASHLRMDPEKVSHFYIRLNFKDRTAGLIAEDKFVDLFPTQPFQVFALPEGHVATIPAVELAGEEGGKGRSSGGERVIIQEVGPKYATYSRSEIDRMMKMQAENITAALAGKMSGQQRSFLEAVEQQEKSFAKITERYVIQFEEARIKLESHTKAVQDDAQAQMAKLNENLSKELTEFRAHVNKNILPISRAIEEKVKEIQVAAAKKPAARKEDLKSTLLGVGAGIMLAIAISTAVLYCHVSQLSELTAQVEKQVQKK